MNRKLFSGIKSQCKTKEQRLAFNKLIKAFADDSHWLDFNKLPWEEQDRIKGLRYKVESAVYDTLESKQQEYDEYPNFWGDDFDWTSSGYVIRFTNDPKFKFTKNDVKSALNKVKDIINPNKAKITVGIAESQYDKGKKVIKCTINLYNAFK